MVQEEAEDWEIVGVGIHFPLERGRKVKNGEEKEGGVREAEKIEMEKRGKVEETMGSIETGDTFSSFLLLTAVFRTRNVWC